MRLIEAVERLNMTGEIGDGMVANLHDLAAGARIDLEKIAKGLEDGTDANVDGPLNLRMCCNGQMCGCRGSTVGEYLAWKFRESVGLPR